MFTIQAGRFRSRALLVPLASCTAEPVTRDKDPAAFGLVVTFLKQLTKHLAAVQAVRGIAAASSRPCLKATIAKLVLIALSLQR